MPRECSVKGCGRRHVAKGLCGMHHERSRVHGSIVRRPRNKNTVIVAPRRGPGEPISEAERRRGETRRKIEDLEAALRTKREDDILREGDW